MGGAVDAAWWGWGAPYLPPGGSHVSPLLPELQEGPKVQGPIEEARKPEHRPGLVGVGDPVHLAKSCVPTGATPTLGPLAWWPQERVREFPEPNSPAAVGWGAPRLGIHPPCPRACPGLGGGVALALGTALGASVLPAWASLGYPQPKGPPDGAGHLEEGWRSPPASGHSLRVGLICCLGSDTPSSPGLCPPGQGSDYSLTCTAPL